MRLSIVHPKSRKMNPTQLNARIQKLESSILSATQGQQKISASLARHEQNFDELQSKEKVAGLVEAGVVEFAEADQVAAVLQQLDPVSQANYAEALTAAAQAKASAAAEALGDYSESTHSRHQCIVSYLEAQGQSSTPGPAYTAAARLIH